MRDPRTADQLGSLVNSFDPWLAVSGSYDTTLDQPAGTTGSIRRALALSGGLSAMRSFQRTVLAFDYSGSGVDYLGHNGRGWLGSNVASLAVSSQVSRRWTLDLSEVGGAANGGFGATAAGLQGGLGVLGSLGVSGGYLSGAGLGLAAVSGGLGALSNGLVDADYYQRMAYFSSTSANAGVLLTDHTMLNFGGGGSFVRREGSGITDSNSGAANVMLSTQMTRTLVGYAGYTFEQVSFVEGSRNADVQGGFAGLRFDLSPHDQLALSASGSYVRMKFATAITLPPDVAALLGVSTTTVVTDSSQSFTGGTLSYYHEFQRGGFNLGCVSQVVPGNDLIAMARSEGCTVSLSRILTPRISVNGIGGARRMNGLSQAGARYDVFSGGLIFSYRVFRGMSLTAGASYRAAEMHPSTTSITGVEASGGLRWSPRDEIGMF